MANIVVSVPESTINVDIDTSIVNVSQTTNQITVSEQARTSNTDIRAALSAVDAGGLGSFTYATLTGVFTYTGPSETEVKGLISVNDTGGDGSLAYNSTSGVITYTGPSASEVRAHLSNTAPINYDSSTGVISIDEDAVFSGKTTDDLAEGSTNLYYTDARSRDAISLTVNAPGGDGLLTYSNTTGVFSFTPANVPVTTDELTEGTTNLYLNGTGDTDDLAEGTANLWYTDARFDTRFATKDTDDLPEGSTNFYYSNARVYAQLLTDLGPMKNADGGGGVNEAANVPVIFANIAAGNIQLIENDSGTPGWRQPQNFFNDVRINFPTTEFPNENNNLEIYNDGDIVLAPSSSNGGRGRLLTTQIRMPRHTAGDVANTRHSVDIVNDDTDGFRITTAWGGGSGASQHMGNISANANIVIESPYGLTADSIESYSAGNLTINSNTKITDTLYIDNIRPVNDGNVELFGNLNVSGNLNYVNVEDLLVNDQSITLNYGNASARDVFIISDRSGSALTNVAIKWNETTDKWQFSNDGVTYEDFISSTTAPVISVNTQTGAVVLDTDDISEGTTNKYYATSLFNTDFATKTTTDLTEGANLYYTDARFDTRFATKTTTDLTEGTNLYYTTDRANSAIEAHTGNIANLTGDVTTTGNITGGYITAGNDGGGDGIFIGDINGAVQQEVRNDTGDTLAKGKAVYLTGAVTGDTPHVALANAENAAHMPAIGIVKNNIPDTETGEIVTGGQLNIGTHGFTLGSQLFINGAGDLTETIPLGESNLVQKIGKVVNAQQIIVQGAGRTNATPNLDDGNIFLGDTNNQARSVTPSSNFATTGNVFDLSNTITGVNSITTEVSDTQKMTLTANAGLIVNQAQSTDNILADSANIDSEGYGFLLNGSYDSFASNYTYSGTVDMFAIKFAGTITKGSANIVVTDVADSQTAFPGNTTELANVNQYMSYSFTNNTFADTKHFPRSAYVQSVDTGNNIITMSENATANATLTTASGGEGAVHAAMVNTETGAVVRFASGYDGGGGPSGYTQILADVPYINPDAYGYGSSSGIRIADYTNASSGSLSDYTCNTSAFAGTMHARQQFVSPGDYPKFADGLVIGKTTNMTNRAEFDVLSNFGLNMMWDGRENTGNPSKIPQYLLKSYTDNTLASSSASSAGPRVFFTSAFGNADNAELDTYPRENQELGRLTWWGTSGTNTGYSTTNPPAYISVQARDDWSAGGNRHGGNVDMYFAAASDHDSRADIFLSYDQGGRLILGSNGYNNNANSDVIIGHAQTGGSGTPQSAYGNNPEAWAKINYGTPANSSGSMFTITNGGRAGADQVGEMLLAFDRINNTSNVDTNAEAWGNGQTITDINTAFGGSWANNTSINANSLTLIDQSATSVYPDGTAFYLTSAGGDVNSSSLNGATYYTYYQGFTGDAFYTLYTDALFTTEALLTVSWTGGYAGGPGSNFAPFETSWGGTLTQTVSGGVTDKKWIYKLPEQSDNLELFEDEWSSGSGATPHTTFTAGGNVTISGNVTYNGITLPTADGTNGQVIQTNGSGALSFTAAGSGTVTSIDVAGGSGLTSSGGPITSSGTITVDVGAGTGITVNADDIAVDEGHTFNFTSAISAANLSLQQFQETVVNMGNQGGDISTVAEFNAANASIFTFTATSDFTISSIPNAQVGSSYTIKVTQDGTGDKVLTSTFKFAGGDKTMSTAADTIDVISVVYDGTDYLASLTKGYA